MDRFTIAHTHFHPASNEAIKDGEVIRMEPKTMELLVFLARHPGGTVGKEDIFKAVWPAVVVGDDSITRCIAQLRKLFGDDHQHPRVLETIPKKGYRLIAAVTRPDGTASKRQAPRPFIFHPIVFAGTVAFIASLAVFASGRSVWNDLAIVLGSMTAAYTLGAFLSRFAVQARS